MKGGSRKQELVLTLSILGRKVPLSNIKYRLVASINRGNYIGYSPRSLWSLGE